MVMLTREFGWYYAKLSEVSRFWQLFWLISPQYWQTSMNIHFTDIYVLQTQHKFRTILKKNTFSHMIRSCFLFFLFNYLNVIMCPQNILIQPSVITRDPRSAAAFAPQQPRRKEGSKATLEASSTLKCLSARNRPLAACPGNPIKWHCPLPQIPQFAT